MLSNQHQLTTKHVILIYKSTRILSISVIHRFCCSFSVLSGSINPTMRSSIKTIKDHRLTITLNPFTDREPHSETFLSIHDSMFREREEFLFVNSFHFYTNYHAFQINDPHSVVFTALYTLSLHTRGFAMRASAGKALLFQVLI